MCRFAPVSHFVSRSPIGTRLLGCTHSHSSHGTAAASPGRGRRVAGRALMYAATSVSQPTRRKREAQTPEATETGRARHRDTAADAQHETARAPRGRGAHVNAHAAAAPAGSAGRPSSRPRRPRRHRAAAPESESLESGTQCCCCSAVGCCCSSTRRARRGTVTDRDM